MHQDNDLLPFQNLSYYLNEKEKRVFLLVDAPDTKWQNWETIQCRLLEWGKDKMIWIEAEKLLELVETKALIPYTPKYVD